MKKYKNNRGVTIIALAITIIVMLILAGVTINNITGGNNIFSNAKKSKEMTEIEEEKKVLNISIVSAMKSSSNGNVTEDNLKTALNSNGLKNKYEFKKNGDSFEVTIIKTGNKYIILEDGTISDGSENDEILLSPNSIPSLGIGKTTEIQAEIGSNVSSDLEVNWKTSDDTIVEILEKDESNKKIKIKGNKNGEAIIEASINIKDGEITKTKTAFCKVIVMKENAEQLTEISLDSSNITIDLGSPDTKEIQLNANVNADGLVWTSSNPLVAIVDDTGKVIGKSNGTTLVSVQNNNGMKAQCVVTVQTSPTKVIISESYITLDLINSDIAPKSKKIKVKIEPETANVNNEIKWITSNSNVVTIKQDDIDDTTATITGVGNGEGKITVQTSNGKTSETIVKVQSTPLSN